MSPLLALEQACAGFGFAQRRDSAIIAVFPATGIRLSELAGIPYSPGDHWDSELDLLLQEIIIGKGSRPRIYKVIARRGRQAGSRCPRTGSGITSATP